MKRPHAPDRIERLAGAADTALARLELVTPLNAPALFAPLGEVLFWLVALAEANGRPPDPLTLALKWPRNRITHGVLAVAPAETVFGSEPGLMIPGLAQLGTVSGFRWLARSAVPLGPDERSYPDHEGAYDALLDGREVRTVLRGALATFR